MTLGDAVKLLEDMDWLSYENSRTPEQLEAWNVVKQYAKEGQRFQDEEQDGVHDT